MLFAAGHVCVCVCVCVCVNVPRVGEYTVMYVFCATQFHCLYDSTAAGIEREREREREREKEREF